MERNGTTDGALEREVTAIARRLAEGSAGGPDPLIGHSWWNERMLDWAMTHPSFKTELFRFVDVFPATAGSDDVLRHLEEYFGSAEAPAALDLGLGLAERVPFGPTVTAAVARR